MAGISDFKAQLIGGGARPSQFRAELTFPTWVNNGTLAGQKAQFLCFASSLPASTVEDIPVAYRGRIIHLAGERVFGSWGVNIYNDSDFAIKNAFEDWSSGIQSFSKIEGRTSPSDYQVDLRIHQLDRNGDIIKSYKFVDAYPTNISGIELSFDAVNQIETFSVEFIFNYFEPL